MKIQDKEERGSEVSMKMSLSEKIILLMTLLASLVGCSTTPRPVLYPNQHLLQVGEAKAEQDIEECISFAQTAGVSRYRDGDIARKSIAGSVVGAAGAGTAAVIMGRDPKYILAGAAGGAAAGAAKGAIDSTDINPTFRNFVQRCLAEKGYVVIGWE